MLQISDSVREEKEVVGGAEVVVTVEMTLIDNVKSGDHHQDGDRHLVAMTGVGHLQDVVSILTCPLVPLETAETTEDEAHHHLLLRYLDRPLCHDRHQEDVLGMKRLQVTEIVQPADLAL